MNAQSEFDWYCTLCSYCPDSTDLISISTWHLYYPISCNRKCDATRSMVFSKLPPVLNIQLARYVFDRWVMLVFAHCNTKNTKAKIRVFSHKSNILWIHTHRETLSKRKLQTKVLLPKSLELPPSATESHKPAKYILCAVQNHLGMFCDCHHPESVTATWFTNVPPHCLCQGTSAHGGHYIADVMDWSTGVWHEFNDSEVTILENGPTSSFKTSDDSMEEENSVEESKVSGSADAYNLFYVDQEYLATHYKTELECMGTETKAEQSNNVLTCIKVERQERYHRELEWVQAVNVHIPHCFLPY